MDVIYRGIETSLLGLTLVFAMAALALPTLSPRIVDGSDMTVTVPLLSVTAAH